MDVQDLKNLRDEMAGYRMFVVFTPQVRRDCVEVSEKRLEELLISDDDKAFPPATVLVKEVHSL